MPSRILVVSFDFPPMLGGIATCAENVCRSLAKDGSTRVRVITARRAGAPRPDLPFEVIHVPFARRSKLAPFLFAPVVAWHALLWRPEAVLNLLWLPDGLACALGTLGGLLAPYFVFTHGVEVMESRRNRWKRLRGAFAPVKNFVLRRASGVFSVSQFTKQLVQEFCGVDEARIHVVNNGVNCDEFAPAERSNSSCTFLSVCRLDDYKGVDQVIRAIDGLRAQFPSVQYQVAGTGADLPRLKRLVRERGLEQHVRFLGAVSQDRLRHLYQQADCFVLPCREDREAPNVEGFGIVFLEAAAAGLPVIAGASGGVADAVAHGVSGWLVNPLSVEELAGRMAEIAGDSDLRRELGRRGRERAARDFTWDSACEKIRGGMAAHVRN